MLRWGEKKKKRQLPIGIVGILKPEDAIAPNHCIYMEEYTNSCDNCTAPVAAVCLVHISQQDLQVSDWAYGLGIQPLHSWTISSPRWHDTGGSKQQSAETRPMLHHHLIGFSLVHA